MFILHAKRLAGVFVFTDWVLWMC